MARKPQLMEGLDTLPDISHGAALLLFNNPEFGISHSVPSSPVPALDHILRRPPSCLLQWICVSCLGQMAGRPLG